MLGSRRTHDHSIKSSTDARLPLREVEVMLRFDTRGCQLARMNAPDRTVQGIAKRFQRYLHSYPTVFHEETCVDTKTGAKLNIRIDGPCSIYEQRVIVHNALQRFARQQLTKEERDLLIHAVKNLDKKELHG